jgi:hypothetical protein
MTDPLLDLVERASKCLGTIPGNKEAQKIKGEIDATLLGIWKAKAQQAEAKVVTAAAVTTAKAATEKLNEAKMRLAVKAQEAKPTKRRRRRKSHRATVAAKVTASAPQPSLNN